jgi:hypothetical protein
MSDSNDYTKRGKFCGSELSSQKVTTLALAPVQIRYLPNVLKLDNIKHQPLEINKIDALQYGGALKEIQNDVFSTDNYIKNGHWETNQ